MRGLPNLRAHHIITLVTTKYQKFQHFSLPPKYLYYYSYNKEKILYLAKEKLI